ncbi:RGD1309106 [Phodopus roborovskii]|uniref:RGD1309106 protein n=1 Tax=Phodopus roborovskii TaxID=109678 RepID=A0AAU9Z9K3_PHORO|nr:RGD1309106 [Phodopus roborovskii]
MPHWRGVLGRGSAFSVSIPWMAGACPVYHASATVLTLSKKDMDLPNLLQVPDIISKARKNEHENLSPRNKQLYSTFPEMKTVQPKNFTIPHRDEKPSFQNSVNHRVMLLHHPHVQQFNHPCNDILTESIHYRLPIMGPRTAIFHRLLSGAYKTPQETQHFSFPRKKQKSKTHSETTPEENLVTCQHIDSGCYGLSLKCSPQ